MVMRIFNKNLYWNNYCSFKAILQENMCMSFEDQDNFVQDNSWENIKSDTTDDFNDKLYFDTSDIEFKASGKKGDKKRKKTKGAMEHPLDKFGTIRKTFILENIRTIDYRDLAELVGIESEELKEAVEKLGVKLPIERAKSWGNIDVGKFKSLTDCSRCQVQLNHSTFFVGINKCRKCIEKNIRYWIEKNVYIKLNFHKE